MCQGLVLRHHCDFGYPDGPEMNDCKLQLQQFVHEWKLMQCPSSVAVSELEIGDKSPEVLLQEMIHQMESECKQILSIDLSIQPQKLLLLLVFSHVLKQLINIYTIM